MKTKKLLTVVLALAMVLALVLGGCAKPAAAEGTKSFTVTVVHADGTSKDFSYTTDEEYLGTVLLAEGLVAGEDSDYGLFVTTVDGETADYNADGSYWAFYVGEDYASLGVDQTPVNDGDTFRLVYTVG